jgi:diguanylate cyclase (GGDEF)-like protein
MKAYMGGDVKTELNHTFKTTSANEYYLNKAHNLLHVEKGIFMLHKFMNRVRKLSYPHKITSIIVLAALVVFIHLFIDLTDYDRTDLINKFEKKQTPVSGELVLIEIDDKSIKHFNQWPWPRGVYASFLQQLKSAQPEIVAFDIDFSSVSFVDQDLLLARQLSNTNFPVVLASIITGRDQKTFHENIPIELFSKHALLANANAILEPSGLVLYYSAVADNRRLSLGGLLAEVKIDAKEILIDYSFNPYTIERVSFKDIVLGNFDAKKLRGKKLLVGASAIELGDQFAVPKYGRLPGVVIHALGYESLIAEQHFVELHPNFILFIAIVLLCATLILLHRSKFIYVISIHSCLYIIIYISGDLLHDQLKVILPTSLLYITVTLSFLWQLFLIIQHKTLVLFKEKNRNNYQSALINQMIKNSSNAIVITDEKGRIKVANDRAKEMLHINNVAVELGEKIFKYLQQSETLIDKLKKPENTEYELTDFIELPFVNIAGQEFYIELLVSRTMFEQSHLLGIGDKRQQIFDITITDMTEKMRIISQSRQSEIELIDLKNNDSLTKLANKSSLTRYVSEICNDYPQRHCMLMLINLDTLKEINSIYGLVFGDNVICQVALLLKDYLSNKGRVFRFSNGVFAVVYNVELVLSETEKQACLQEIYLLFSKAIEMQGQKLLMSVSLSMSDTSQCASNMESIVDNAVQTLDYVKLNNKIDYLVYDSGFINTLKSKALLKKEILRGIKNQEFVLYYQTQHDLRDDRVSGVEALIRWNDPYKGLRYPDEFIPIAEEFGIIDEIGELVIALGCKDAHRLPDDVTVAINVSASQFTHSDIPGLCAKYLKQNQITAQQLELEITESMMMHDFELVREKLKDIQNMGISVAMDDFGTGYSSLQYLTKLPFDKLKVDRSFTTHIVDSEQDKALLNSIISLGFSANKQVLVEGIENIESMHILREMGCELGQGYFYSKPQPIEEIIEKLTTSKE